MAALRAKRGGSLAAWRRQGHARTDLLAAAGRIDRDGAAGGHGIVSCGSVVTAPITPPAICTQTAPVCTAAKYTPAPYKWRGMLPRVVRAAYPGHCLISRASCWRAARFLLERVLLLMCLDPVFCGAQAEYESAPAGLLAPAGAVSLSMGGRMLRPGGAAGKRYRVQL